MKTILLVPQCFQNIFASGAWKCLLCRNKFQLIRSHFDCKNQKISFHLSFLEVHIACCRLGKIHRNCVYRDIHESDTATAKNNESDFLWFKSFQFHVYISRWQLYSKLTSMCNHRRNFQRYLRKTKCINDWKWKMIENDKKQLLEEQKTQHSKIGRYYAEHESQIIKNKANE